MKMEKWWSIRSLAWLLILSCFATCSAPDIDKSGVQHDPDSNFIIRSIHNNGDDGYLIIGTINLTTHIVCRKYSKNLKDFDLLDFSGNTGIYWHNGISIQFENGQFQVAHYFNNENGTKLEMAFFDIKLNDIRRKTISIQEDPSYGEYYITRFIELSKSGGYMLVMDTTLTTRIGTTYRYGRSGIRIQVYDNDLNKKWDFEGQRSGSYGTRIPYRIDAIELSDGSIFYHIDEYVITPYFEQLSVFGLLNDRGEVIYQETEIQEDLSRLSPLGMSKSGENALLHYYNQDGILLNYRLYEPYTGKELFNRELKPGNDSTQLFRNALELSYDGNSNSLPYELNEVSGHILYSEERGEFFYQMVNSEGNVKKEFFIPSIPFETPITAQSFVTNDQNILVGINYFVNEKLGFDLLIFSPEGKLISD